MKRMEYVNENEERCVDYMFNTLHEFRKFLVDNEGVKTLYRSSHNTGEWSGIETWEDFIRYLKEGDKESQKMKKMTHLHINKLKQFDIKVSEWVYDVEGMFFDVGAVLMGEPEAWLQEVNVTDEKFVTLNINASFTSNVNTSTVRENAAKLLALSVALEKSGIRTEINMNYRSRNVEKGGKSVSNVITKGKALDEPLNYKKLAILLSPQFFRRGVFRVRELEYGKTLNYGYGHSKGLKGHIQLSDTEKVDELINDVLGVKE